LLLEWLRANSLVQEFARGLQLDGENVELQEEAKAARHLLSLEDLHKVR